MASVVDELYGWEISALFVLFMLISILWQVFIAVLTFLNSLHGGAKTIWLNRLKEEVLDVGVISLALVFVSPFITTICVPSSSSTPSDYFPPPAASDDAAPETNSSPDHRLVTTTALAVRRALAGGAAAPCPAGQRHLFPSDSINSAHYLLFLVALVHIVYSLLTFTLTLERFRTWSGWERISRADALEAAASRLTAGSRDTATPRLTSPRPVVGPPGPAFFPSEDRGPGGGAVSARSRSRGSGGGGGSVGCLALCGRALGGGVDRERYLKLRGLFQLRSRAYGATTFASQLHFAGVCENAMHIDMGNVVAHGWLQALIMAVFTLYTTKFYQVLWVAGFFALVQVAVVIKLQSVLSRVLQMVTKVEVRNDGGSSSMYSIDTTGADLQQAASHTLGTPARDAAGTLTRDGVGGAEFGSATSQPERAPPGPLAEGREGSGVDSPMNALDGTYGTVPGGMGNSGGQTSLRASGVYGAGDMALTVAGGRRAAGGVDASRVRRQPLTGTTPGGGPTATRVELDTFMGTAANSRTNPLFDMDQPTPDGAGAARPTGRLLVVPSSPSASYHAAPASGATSGDSASESPGTSTEVSRTLNPTDAAASAVLELGTPSSTSRFANPLYRPGAAAGSSTGVRRFSDKNSPNSTTAYGPPPGSLRSPLVLSPMAPSPLAPSRQPRQLVANNDVDGRQSDSGDTEATAEPSVTMEALYGRPAAKRTTALAPAPAQRPAAPSSVQQAPSATRTTTAAPAEVSDAVLALEDSPGAGTPATIHPATQTLSNLVRPDTVPVPRHNNGSAFANRNPNEATAVDIGTISAVHAARADVNEAAYAGSTPFADPSVMPVGSGDEVGGCYPDGDGGGGGDGTLANMPCTSPPGDVDMTHVEDALQGLFWWGRPQFLIWLSHVVFTQSSLSLTLCIYTMLSHGSKASLLKMGERLLYIWIPLLVLNLIVLVATGWVVLPLYTLLTATATRNPRGLLEHIRRHKKADMEEEGGVTGFLLELCTRYFLREHHAVAHRHHHHAVHGPARPYPSTLGDQTLRPLGSMRHVFLSHLAHQSGVAVALEPGAGHHELAADAAAVYRDFLWVWLAKVRLDCKVGSEPPGGRFAIEADVSVFGSTYASLDADGSNAVTVRELSAHLHLHGSRASPLELAAMIEQIDDNGDKKVCFFEFLVFMVFCFLDADANGRLEVADIWRASRSLKLGLTSSEVSAMLQYASPEGDGRINLREFFRVFKDVDLPPPKPQPGDANAANMATSPGKLNSRTATQRAHGGSVSKASWASSQRSRSRFDPAFISVVAADAYSSRVSTPGGRDRDGSASPHAVFSGDRGGSRALGAPAEGVEERGEQRDEGGLTGSGIQPYRSLRVMIPDT